MIRIEEDPAHPEGGFARITVPGMAGREVSAVAIGREGYGADSLGPEGWQVASARLVPDAVSASGEDLVLVLGPSVVEHLEAGPIRLALPEVGLAEVVMWPEIAPLPAAARGGFAGVRPVAPPKVQPAPPQDRTPQPLSGPPSGPDPDSTVVTRASPDQTGPPAGTPAGPSPGPTTRPLLDPTAPASAARRRAPLLLLLLLILLAAAAAAGWWFREPLLAMLDRPPAPPPSIEIATPEPGPPPQSAPAPEPAPALAGDPTDSMTPAEIAALNLPPDRVFAIAEARQAQGRHQDALLLLEVAANAPYGPAMSALARLYDPASFIPGGALSVPNPAKAAQYWRAAEQAGDPAAAPARAALRTRLEAAAAAGDAVAAIALQDNWP